MGINFKPVSILVIILFLITMSLFPQTPPQKKVVNLGPPVNTQYDDFSPSITADGKTMVFNSKRGSKYQDIYITFFENGRWSEPRALNELNSQYNDESPYITPDGEFIFFSSDRDGSFEMPANRAGQVKVSFDLYVSKKINGSWDTPIQVPGSVNTIHHERSPSMSLDLQYLFYSQWPFGDIEKARIIRAEYRDGDFINPEVLPAQINAGGQEAGLVPSPDGKGYFFSSRRSGSYGGWDIFYVGFENGKFGDVLNAGPEINSQANEIYLTFAGNTMFFCSNRQGGYGLYDIYTSKIPDVTEMDNRIKIIVRDKKTKKPLSVEMNVTAKVKEAEGKTATYEIKKNTDENGEAVIQYNPQLEYFDVIIDEKGYLPFFKTIDIPEAKGKPQVLELVPVEKEASFDIHSIHFDFESAKIKPESYPYLNALAEYLKKHPSMKFEIIGHTDLHGTDAFNNKLSRERAEAVRDYLAARGLDKKRFSVSGAGKSKPRVPQIGPGFDEENRRTEFKLLEK